MQSGSQTKAAGAVREAPHPPGRRYRSPPGTGPPRMKRYIQKLQKPKALRRVSRLGIVPPSSPAEAAAISAGTAELRRLGFQVEEPAPMVPQGYFAASHDERLQQFCQTVHDKQIDGVIATRGGYGANYLIDSRLATRLRGPKCMVGFTDFNILQLLM